MPKRYCTIGLLAGLIPMLLLLAACGSEKKMSMPSGETAEDLIEYYNTMRQVGLAGKVAEFVAMRDSVTNAEVADYYKWHGWELDSAKVSNWAFNWPEVDDFTIVQDTISGLWRRILFQKCEIFDKDGREKCLYPMILFRKEGDQWKVSNATRMAAPRYTLEGNPITLDKLTFHRMFGLPPSFEDLHQQPVLPSDSSRPAEKPYDSIPVPAWLKDKGKTK